MGRGLLVAGLVVVALAVGVVVGMTIGGAPQETETQKTVATSIAGAAPSGGDTPAQPALPRARGGGASRASGDDGRALADSLGASVTAPEGEGAIRGTVRTSGGTPVEGLEVAAYANAPAEWAKEVDGKRQDEIPFETRIRRYARAERWRDATTRTGRTGADGTYTITGVAELAHRVDVRSATHRARPAQGARSDGVRPGGVVDFVVEPRSGVLVDVRMPDGTAPDAANVRFEQGGQTQNTGWSPSWTRTEVAPGRWRLVATSGRFDELQSEPMDIEVPEQMAAAPTTVRLVARRGILVDPRPAAGFEGLGVSVRVLDAAGFDVESPDARRSRGAREVDSGESAFLDLAPGRYSVTASHDGQTVATADAVVADGLARVTVQAPAPDASRVVEVAIIPARQAPSGKVDFQWTHESPRSRTTFAARSAARGNGTWTVLVPGADDRPNSSSSSGRDDSSERAWKLSLRIDNVPRGDAAWTAGTRRVEIAVREPMWLDVVVDGVAGTGLERKLRVNLQIVKRDGGGMSAGGMANGNGKPDASGRCRLGPLEPIGCELVLNVGERGGYDSPELARVVVEGAAGAREVRVTLPALHTVTFEMGSKSANQTLMIRAVKEGERTSSGYFHVTADGNGRAVAQYIPPGTYAVRAGPKEIQFRVPEQTLVRAE